MIAAAAAPEHPNWLRGTGNALRWLLVPAIILIPAAPAFANSLASWVWVWPGVVSLDPFLGLLPTLLVSFVERPFVCRAGVVQRPLIRSIRANVLSLIGGIPVSMFVWNVRSEGGLFLLAGVAVTVSIVIEGVYYRSFLRKECRELCWLWIVFGNVISSVLLVSIALGVRTLEDLHPQLGCALLPYYGGLQLIGVGLCITTAVVALAEPTMRVFRAVHYPGTTADTSMEVSTACAADKEQSNEEILLISGGGR